MQAALTAVLPERTPVSRRGTISGILGMISIVGAVVGVVIGGLGGSIAVGYLTIAMLVLTFGVLFALTTKDLSPVQIAALIFKPAGQTSAPSRGSLPHSSDFWWTFAGRFAIILAYQIFQGYLIYILDDYIHLGKSNPTLPVATAVVILSGFGSITLILSASLGGWISDKVGRLKPFVFWSSAGLALPLLLLLLVPTWPAMILAQMFMGLTIGLYFAVDQALITRVLPNLENAARDLGILNIANTGPQIVAPFVAGVIISVSGGYQTLFIVSLILAIVAALCIRPIRSVR